MKLYKHPLYAMADRLKRAFMVSGFSLLEDDRTEIAGTDRLQKLMKDTENGFAPMYLEDGDFALRTSLLTEHLPSLAGKDRIRAVISGIVYDQGSGQYPQHIVLEGVISEEDITFFELNDLWNRIVREVYGICASCEIASGTIIVHTDEKEIRLGRIAQASWIARALLQEQGSAKKVYIFSIDADEAAMGFYGMDDRAELFSPVSSDLKKIEDETPSCGVSFREKTRDVLRSSGYLEFIGERFYTADAYVRMNMIQESWDTNNKALLLQKPVDGYDSVLTECTDRPGLPTVLAPSLEQALYENFKAGETEVKLFEISHIYKPAGKGKQPWEKTSLSFGMYREGLTIREFRQEVDRILTSLGVKNHFFIPTDMAIAYKTDECFVILDEKMTYLDGNCGHISPKALANYRIATDAFMAQFELDTIERKARSEYGFVPYELRGEGEDTL